MTEEKRIRDHVVWGSAADVQMQLEDLRKAFLACSEWIKTNVERTERNLVLFNLLIGSVPYLDLLVRNTEGAIQLVALCTRGIYELNLRARCILKADAAIEAWQAECATDRIEVLEGVLQLSGAESTAAKRLLEMELERIKGLAKQYGLPEKIRPATVADMAKAAGLETEHKAFFKLFSKLVHPSSYLVNSAELANDNSTRNILLVNLQVYALDLLQRLRKAFGMPDELLEKLV